MVTNMSGKQTLLSIVDLCANRTLLSMMDINDGKVCKRDTAINQLISKRDAPMDQRTSPLTKFASPCGGSAQHLLRPGCLADRHGGATRGRETALYDSSIVVSYRMQAKVGPVFSQNNKVNTQAAAESHSPACFSARNCSSEWL